MAEIWEDLQEAYEEGFDARREVFGADLCNIYGPTFTDGGATGDSSALNPTPLASNVACLVTELSGASVNTIVGGEAYVSSHGIEMKRSAVVLAITPRHQIKVLARDGRPDRTFEKPVIPEKSFLPLVIAKASLVRQGYD